MAIRRGQTRQRASLLGLATVAALLGACANLHTTVPRPTRSEPEGVDLATCVSAITRAYVALARGPDSTGVAHAEHAAAMHEYHTCLARTSR